MVVVDVDAGLVALFAKPSSDAVAVGGGVRHRLHSTGVASHTVWHVRTIGLETTDVDTANGALVKVACVAFEAGARHGASTRSWTGTPDPRARVGGASSGCHRLGLQLFQSRFTVGRMSASLS